VGTCVGARIEPHDDTSRRIGHEEAWRVREIGQWGQENSTPVASHDVRRGAEKLPVRVGRARQGY